MIDLLDSFFTDPNAGRAIAHHCPSSGWPRSRSMQLRLGRTFRPAGSLCFLMDHPRYPMISNSANLSNHVHLFGFRFVSGFICKSDDQWSENFGKTDDHYWSLIICKPDEYVWKWDTDDEWWICRHPALHCFMRLSATPFHGCVSRLVGCTLHTLNTI